MLDAKGYRLNVGIILINDKNQVFWGRRTRGSDSWQFPQGGVHYGETLEETLYRELQEEIGLAHNQVKLVARTNDWLYYDIPDAINRSNGKYKGQKQIWFLLKMLGQDADINLNHQQPAEFSEWHWLDYWTAPSLVIDFKQDVYKKALKELSRFVKI